MKISKHEFQNNTVFKGNNQAAHKSASSLNENVSIIKARIEMGKIRIVKNFNDGQSFEGNAQDNIDVQLDQYTNSNHQPAQMCFLYVGTSELMVQHFNNHFESGYKQTDLNEAGNFIVQLYLHNHKLPDAIFIDLPLEEEALVQFAARMKYNILLSNLPVIYNEKQLTPTQIKRLNQVHLIDDIITIGSDKIDYFSKVMFLKQCKLYNQVFYPKKEQRQMKVLYALKPSLIAKRIIDITLSFLGLALMLPVFLIIAAIIMIESRGPVFYTSLRAGRGFKVFKFYKFRSMVADAEQKVDMLNEYNQYDVTGEGPKFFKINNDPRVTRFGRFLRNTSFDELPQLLNVLKGDMSIVGNRPLPIYEAVSLTTNDFVERFSAPAGITGLWQVNKRGKSDMSIHERISLDIYYSRNCNFLYDLKIMVKTPIALFQKSDV